jgi:cell division septum initiation protein DivIVA
MNQADDEVQQLREEVQSLRDRIRQLESTASGAHQIESDVTLTKAQIERYARHITLKSFGPFGAPLAHMRQVHHHERMSE